ncbi:ankyrin repeat protein [Ostertagia ostertagi]
MATPSSTFILLLLIACCCQSAATAQSSPADSIARLQLFQTIRSGDAVKLESMLQNGANPNAVMGDYSALMAAALSGTAEEMTVLINHGADVNYANKDGISAIWLAVPDRGKTTLLMGKGANVQQRSREGNTVLVKLASIPGSAGLLQLLIAAGCDPQKSGIANDIMFNAAASGDTAVLGLLIRHAVSVSDTCSFGDYPINAATNYRTFETLKMLVEHGAAVNVSPAHGILPLFIGMTPLMWAAVSNDKPSFYYLLEHGADAKAKSPGGYSTLMFLAMADADDPKMTQALIDHGASPADKALDETDALYHFKLRGNTPSVELLTKTLIKK